VSSGRDVIRNVRHVLLDFDGPVCTVFGTIPDHAVADILRAYARTYGHEPAGHVVTSPDPFCVLADVAASDRTLAVQVNQRFRELEVEAVSTAPVTPGAIEAVESWVANDRSVAIVSNNSTEAVRRFLDTHEK
jgi:phosphoglycolate phosphatase